LASRSKNKTLGKICWIKTIFTNNLTKKPLRDSQE